MEIISQGDSDQQWLWVTGSLLIALLLMNRSQGSSSAVLESLIAELLAGQTSWRLKQIATFIAVCLVNSLGRAMGKLFP